MNNKVNDKSIALLQSRLTAQQKNIKKIDCNANYFDRQFNKTDTY